VHEAVVVTASTTSSVEQAIAARSGGRTVRTIFNPFYKVADNTGSLYMAREELAATAWCGTATRWFRAR
jgi:choline kinase